MAGLTLRVDVDGADGRELHRLTTSLFTDIRRLGVVNVARAEGEAPPNSKSGGAQLAELVVTGVLSGSTLAVVGKVIVAFVNRAKDRSVKITRDGQTWEFTGISEKDQHVLAKLVGAAEDEPAGQ